MNKQNSIRHALSMLRKYKRHSSMLLYSKSNDAFFEIQDFPNFCLKCQHEDFGYCGLRNKEMSPDEMFYRFCADSMIKSLEELL